ncbi:helix-turn-helix transcriptional regulator [Pontitalea aquivivens]|uniref:helix-turn-helix transcriptional regulator n=1 Tax=Pontitalea aquivivens TaxID=3388663 RepID=UPI003970BE1C
MNAAAFTDDFSSPLSENCTAEGATLCFVGSAIQFPDAVLRTVQSELRPVQPIRAPSLAALLDSPSQKPFCALVVEESQAGPLITARADRHPALSDAGLIIAYTHRDAAQGLIRSQGQAVFDLAISLLPMNLNLETWLAVLRMALSGGHYIPPDLMGRAGAQGTPATAPPAPEDDPCTRYGLTPRETQVLQMLSLGQANKAIALQMNLSEHTVKLHIHRIIAKLGVNNRTEAALVFHRAHHG